MLVFGILNDNLQMMFALTEVIMARTKHMDKTLPQEYVIMCSSVGNFEILAETIFYSSIFGLMSVKY